MFWVNLGIAFAATALLLPLAGFVAEKSGLPSAVPVIWGAVGLMAISAAGVVPLSLLRRPPDRAAALAKDGMLALIRDGP